MNIRDIYRTVHQLLIERKIEQASFMERRLMLREEIVHYTLGKLEELGVSFGSVEEPENLAPLFEVMYQKLEDKNEKKKIFEQYTHFLLSVISDIQSYEVIWYVDSDEDYIDMPVAQYTNGYMDKLITHEQTNELKALLLVNEVFNEFIPTEEVEEEKRMKLSIEL